MYIKTAAMITAIGMTLSARPGTPADERKVTVCMPARPELDISYARYEAREMFRRIGVDIEWRAGANSCPPGALSVSLDAHAPASFHPNALAYALPYEGTSIHVFYDRVQAAVVSNRVRFLMAHVLVHEITHVLEGVSRHSASGVMKANWDDRDYEDMAWRPLPFAVDDVYLIQNGLAARNKDPRNHGFK